jgi:Na+:H+ antiporter
MFKDAGIKGRLRLLVESESLLNDGVAAVLFALVLGWAQATGEAATPMQVALALVHATGGSIWRVSPAAERPLWWLDEPRTIWLKPP